MFIFILIINDYLMNFILWSIYINFELSLWKKWSVYLKFFMIWIVLLMVNLKLILLCYVIWCMNVVYYDKRTWHMDHDNYLEYSLYSGTQSKISIKIYWNLFTWALINRTFIHAAHNKVHFSLATLHWSGFWGWPNFAHIQRSRIDQKTFSYLVNNFIG